MVFQCIAFGGMRRRVVPLALVGLLIACAHTPPAPVVHDSVTPEENLGAYTLLNITSDTSQGVMIPQAECRAVLLLVRDEILVRAPDRFVRIDTPSSKGAEPAPLVMVSEPRTLNMHIAFTRYDEGDPFTQFMLAGLEQIHVAADVTLSDDATGRVIGQYDVSKQFALGGVYGASTTIEDVEEGLAAGIADSILDGAVAAKARNKAKREPQYP